VDSNVTVEGIVLWPVMLLICLNIKDALPFAVEHVRLVSYDALTAHAPQMCSTLTEFAL